MAAKLRRGLNLPPVPERPVGLVSRPALAEQGQALDAADAAAAALPAGATAGEGKVDITVQCLANGARVSWQRAVRLAPAQFAMAAGRQTVLCKASGHVDTSRTCDAVAGQPRLVAVDTVAAATNIRRDIDTTMQLRAGLGYFLIPRLSLGNGGSGPSRGSVRYTSHGSSGDSESTHYADLTISDVQTAANPTAIACDLSLTGQGFGFAFAFDYLSWGDHSTQAKVRDDDKYPSLSASNYELGNLKAGVPAQVTHLTAPKPTARPTMTASAPRPSSPAGGAR